MAASAIVQDAVYQRWLVLIFLWSVAAISWNIISGYAGQISFGHAAFVGIGAYVSVLLFRDLGWSPWIGMWIGAAVAALAAIIIGLPTFRLAGIYFALATIAYPLILHQVMDRLGYREVTVPFVRESPALYLQFDDPRLYSLLALGLLLISLVFVQAMDRSRMGLVLRATQQNQVVAEAMGVDTFRWKMIAFVVSAALAAIMATIYVRSVLFVLTTEATFGLFSIIRMLSIALVGGLGTVWGPVLGAVILIPIGESLDAQLGDRVPGIQAIVYGIALVLVTMVAPEGLYSRVRDLWIRLSAVPYAATPRTAPLDQPLAPPPTAPPPPAQAPTLLRLEGVSKRFGGLQAVDDVSFEARAGEILGVIGPNGAGKSTLFNILNGILSPDRGRVWFEDREINALPPHRICRLGVGRTFQVAQPFGRLPVVENVMVGAFACCSSADQARQVAEQALAQVGLGGRVDAPVSGLTTLEVKLLELARALATRPRLLLIDEIMAGINPEEIDRLSELLRQVRDGGVTLIVIDHAVRALARLADRLVVLDHGRKIAEGTGTEILNNPQVIEAYLGSRWRQHA